MSNSKKKCLLLSEIFPPKVGGSGRWFWEIYRRLHHSHVVTVAGEHPEAASLHGWHAFPLYRIPLTMNQWGIRSFSALSRYVGLFRQVRRIAVQEQISIVHSGRCLPEGWIAWMLKKICGLPYCCYVHGEDVAAAGTSRELSMMVRQVLGCADYLIANSLNTKNLLTVDWKISADRIRVLYPGTDTQRFLPKCGDSTLRTDPAWRDKTVILTAGRLQRRKGHDMLIRALPQIREAIPGIHYAIAGDGDQRQFLEQLAAENGVSGHVQFLGENTDEQLLTCYQDCDLFALPNRQDGEDIEGFGIVLLEAQACGKPVLAGASGGTAETMNPGVTGLVVPCEQPGPLAEEIIRLLLDPCRCREMGTAAREWVVRNFDWSAQSTQAAQLFDIPLADPDDRCLVPRLEVKRQPTLHRIV